MFRSARTTARLAALAALTLVGLAACESADSRTYVTLLGADTISIEHFTRSDTAIVGELLVRSPYTHRIRYHASLGEDGTIDRLEATMETPPENPEGPEPVHWVAEIGQGEARVTVEGGRAAGERTFAAAADAIPTLGRASISAFALEQAIRQARAAGEDEHALELVYPTRPQPVPNSITRVAGDTVVYSFFGRPFRAWTDADGALAGADGSATTMKATVTRSAAEIDLDARAAAWAAADARGEGMGVASPGATETATVHGATLEIAYSQPAKRGREIWGGLVPHGEVWRTGANAATMFSTNRDLRLGDLDVPAGSYTLWSIYDESGGQLIVNKQTGQWGTQYDPEQDLGRVPMERSELAEPVERFTFRIEETPEGGVIHLDWDRTRWSVPFTVR